MKGDIGMKSAITLIFICIFFSSCVVETKPEDDKDLDEIEREPAASDEKR
jgi:hypothetical protein